MLLLDKIKNEESSVKKSRFSLLFVPQKRRRDGDKNEEPKCLCCHCYV